MLATAGGQECYLLLCNRGQQMSSVSQQFAIRRILQQVHKYYGFQPKHGSCRFPSGEDCSVGGGLFAVQCEAEGHGMVLKLGIKGGERWAGRIQHQLPLLLLLLLLLLLRLHCGGSDGKK